MNKWLYEAIRRTLIILPGVFVGVQLMAMLMSRIGGLAWWLYAISTLMWVVVAYILAGGTWEVQHEG